VFGPPPPNHGTSSLPQHGFARTSRWEFLGKSTSEGAEDPPSVKLDFGLYSSNLSEEARKAWPYDFGLVYSVTLGKDSLQTVMNVRNEGSDVFEFQMLLHTYLRVKVRGIPKLLISPMPNSLPLLILNPWPLIPASIPVSPALPQTQQY
jgi:glucose-6-phosphate 1-epimerase